MGYYTEAPRSADPRAAIMAIMINGGGVLALLTLATSVDLPVKVPPIFEGYNIPEKRVEPPKPKPEPEDQDTAIQQRDQAQPPKDDTAADPMKGTDTSMGVLPGPGDANGQGGTSEVMGGFAGPIIEPPPLPPEPVLTKVRRDERYASAFQPAYPPQMLRSEIGGSVTLRVLVGPDGRVRQVEPVSFSHAEFLRAAERQARKAWRFVPATRDGVAVESWHTVKVTFDLQNA